MNPRRVHELMLEHFPDRPETASDWAVAVDEQGLRFPVLEDHVRRYIATEELLVKLTRKIGGMFPIPAALDFVAAHACNGRILLTDRDFSGFVVVESTGVVSGWRDPGAVVVS